MYKDKSKFILNKFLLINKVPRGTFYMKWNLYVSRETFIRILHNYY